VPWIQQARFENAREAKRGTGKLKVLRVIKYFLAEVILGSCSNKET
jgi:hypothetical protein